MMQARRVLPELLDSLPSHDPAAQRARRDLQRVHRAMGTRRVLLRALGNLRSNWPSGRPLRVLELGAGDGTQLLEVARCLQPAWPAVELTLLDRQPLLSAATQQAYRALGWNAQVCVGDVLDVALWRRDPAQAGVRRWDLVLANLFLHHFHDAALLGLLTDLAASSDRVLACEPRRAPLAWAGSKLIGLLGVNAVTRSDAVLSVQAGFCAQELSNLWPAANPTWCLREYPAGLFSAQRLKAAA
ncbi:MAG: methyltransferase domain-containing protein [Rhodoferax sp.]|nr:methyltransferase domain-containing protein [Rhodoferax sp.]